MKHIENVIVGELLCSPVHLFANDETDWETLEKDQTLFTNERFLPKILVEAGIAPSVSEVRRNRKDLCISLDSPNFIFVKWGKKRLWIGVGE